MVFYPSDLHVSPPVPDTCKLKNKLSASPCHGSFQPLIASLSLPTITPRRMPCILFWPTATESSPVLFQIYKATLPSSWAQTGTHRGISEPVRAQFTYSSNKDAGGKGRVGLWQSCQWRGGNWGSVGLYGRLFKGSGCFCTPLCLSIGPSSGVPLPWAEEPPLRTAPPSLFVLLEKFPSACESQLGSLTGSIWLERRKTGVRVVRFGEGSRLLATREAGWAAPAHRVGRLQGWALGRPRWPSLTVMREGTHGLTTSPLRSH